MWAGVTSRRGGRDRAAPFIGTFTQQSRFGGRVPGCKATARSSLQPAQTQREAMQRAELGGQGCAAGAMQRWAGEGEVRGAARLGGVDPAVLGGSNEPSPAVGLKPLMPPAETRSPVVKERFAAGFPRS